MYIIIYRRAVEAHWMGTRYSGIACRNKCIFFLRLGSSAITCSSSGLKTIIMWWELLVFFPESIIFILMDFCGNTYRYKRNMVNAEWGSYASISAKSVFSHKVSHSLNLKQFSNGREKPQYATKENKFEVILCVIIHRIMFRTSERKKDTSN